MRYCLTGALLALALLILSSRAWADAADVRILIDVSGSMHFSVPASSRREALALLVELLPAGSRAGVWRFAEAAVEVVPFGMVDAAFRSRAASAELAAAGHFTDLAAALTAASAVAPGATGAHILLITDGQLDISRDRSTNAAARAQLLDEHLPALAAAGFKLHTIALGPGADRELLVALALASGGRAAQAATAPALTGAFLAALEAAEPAQGAPLVDGQFVIDSSVEEFTVVVLTPGVPQALADPSGRRFTPGADASGLSWRRQPGFDLITARQPLEGRWQLLGAAGAQVRLLTDLRLMVQGLEPNANLGEPLPVAAALLNRDERITDPELLGLTRLTITGTAADGEPWQKTLTAAADGLFQTLLEPLPAGEHTLALRLEGPTFVREQWRRVNVRPPFEALLEEMRGADGQWSPSLRVRPLSLRIAPATTQVAVSIIDPAGRRQVRPLPRTEAGDWQWPLRLGAAGPYLLVASVSGTGADGAEFYYQLPPLPYQHDPSLVLDGPLAPPPEPGPTPPVEAQPLPLADEAPAPIWPWLLALASTATLAGGVWYWRQRAGSTAQPEPAAPEAPPKAVSPAAVLPVMAMPEPELFDAEPALELPPLRPLEDDLPLPAQDSVDAAELDAAISSLIDELEGNR